MKGFVVLIIFIVMAGFAGSVYALTRSEVEKNLICYACPGEALNIDRCSGGDEMRAEIDRRLELGQDKKTIVNYFADKFGDRILNVPPKKGFNLVAYAAPFAGLLIGLSIAVFLVWKWVVSGRANNRRVEDETEAGEIDPAMGKKVADALKKLEDN